MACNPPSSIPTTPSERKKNEKTIDIYTPTWFFRRTQISSFQLRKTKPSGEISNHPGVKFFYPSKKRQVGRVVRGHHLPPPPRIPRDPGPIWGKGRCASSVSPWQNRRKAWLQDEINGTRRKEWIIFVGKLLSMDVSENSGTPKSSILKGFSIIKHPFWGITIFGNPHITPLPECFGHFG